MAVGYQNSIPINKRLLKCNENTYFEENFFQIPVKGRNVLSILVEDLRINLYYARTRSNKESKRAVSSQEQGTVGGGSPQRDPKKDPQKPQPSKNQPQDPKQPQERPKTKEEIEREKIYTVKFWAFVLFVGFAWFNMPSVTSVLLLLGAWVCTNLVPKKKFFHEHEDFRLFLILVTVVASFITYTTYDSPRKEAKEKLAAQSNASIVASSQSSYKNNANRGNATNNGINIVISPEFETEYHYYSSSSKSTYKPSVKPTKTPKPTLAPNASSTIASSSKSNTDNKQKDDSYIKGNKEVEENTKSDSIKENKDTMATAKPSQKPVLEDSSSSSKSNSLPNKREEYKKEDTEKTTASSTSKSSSSKSSSNSSSKSSSKGSKGKKSNK